MSTPIHDLTIIGGGVVGLAGALAVQARFPRARLCILEKESDIAHHQTSHNSGVIHAGIYYRPGSLKASLCIEGARLLTDFCREHGVPFQTCGKVVVATSPQEIPILQALYQRGQANGVPGLEYIGPERLRELEPHAAGLEAIFSPQTGIIDYRQVAAAMAGILREGECDIHTANPVTGIVREENGWRVQTARSEISTRHLINCAGLYADKIARMAGATPDVNIIPFRGEYYFLKPESRDLVRGLIYPVPDPALPFLGVHFTRTIHGEVEAGPNAVLAFAREGYTMARINPRELLETLTYPGMWALAGRYWRTGITEFHRSLSARAFVAALQQLIPAVQTTDVRRGGSGVRAQAVTRDGRLVDDFHIIEDQRAIHVLNAPSPAATASLAIGDHIATLAAKRFHLAA